MYGTKFCAYKNGQNECVGCYYDRLKHTVNLPYMRRCSLSVWLFNTHVERERESEGSFCELQKKNKINGKWWIFQLAFGRLLEKALTDIGFGFGWRASNWKFHFRLFLFLALSLNRRAHKFQWSNSSFIQLTNWTINIDDFICSVYNLDKRKPKRWKTRRNKKKCTAVTSHVLW